MTPDPATRPAPIADGYPDARVLGDLLRVQRERRPGAGAIAFTEGGSWTWAELADAVGRVQRELARCGVGAGDRVALLCDNSLDMVAVLLGIAGAGAVAVPVNTGLVGAGLAFVLGHCEPRLLVGDPAHLGRLRDAGAASVPAVPSDWYRQPAEVAPRSPATAAPAARGVSTDTAMILYTSGTTGDAKGVVLSHGCILTAARASAGVMFEAGPDDVIYTCLPLFHCAAQQLGLWTALVSGARLVLAPRFSAAAFWPQVHAHGVTAFHFIGPLLSILWKAPPSPADGVHPARLAVGGGPRIAWRPFEDRFGVSCVECYGMTETFGGCVTHRPGQGRLGSAGKALDHIEVQVVDEGGEPLPAGATGEIRIRGHRPGVLFDGYFKRPDLTAAALEGGWYRTGDLGSLDRDGYLTYASRARDIIRCRGENVSAVEVETVCAACPGVAECGVVGVPSELGEDDILVVVVPDQASFDLGDLFGFAAERLPAFAVPRFGQLASELPKTATGRIQRHLLRSFAEGARRRA